MAHEKPVQRPNGGQAVVVAVVEESGRSFRSLNGAVPEKSSGRTKARRCPDPEQPPSPAAGPSEPDPQRLQRPPRAYFRHLNSGSC